jgi:2,3-bisphosphoglycerate-independent phosphoglycerate mutase
MSNVRPCVLVILDGFGERPEKAHNAILLAQTPTLTTIRQKYPMTLLQNFGEAVGLPPGQMGNSEVGHMNLGSGRIIYQDLTRIDRDIRVGDFQKNPTILAAIDSAKKNNGALHLFGLLGDGGVHAHDGHLYALLRLCHEKQCTVFVHAFMDGRDTPPNSGVGFLQNLEDVCQQTNATVASIIGRFYAMDRDKRWDRVEKAFRALVLGEGKRDTNLLNGLSAAYRSGEMDEFIQPILLERDGALVGRIKENDAIFFYNYRADRARELTRAFNQSDFSAFDVSYRPKLSYYGTMTRYDETFGLPVAYGPSFPQNTLGEFISAKHFSQLRCAETEKYAHVTYFFNGGREEPFPLEDRILVPSPKEVKTYDLKPEMSAPGVTKALVEAIRSKKYPLIVANYANADMVGHTGIESAAITAVEVVDQALAEIASACQATGASLLITADHGNIEQMWDDENNQPHTQHTLNPVPFYVVDDQRIGKKLHAGSLCDVAPTVLSMMELAQPREMEGKSLLDS